jgi:hypothetical protein
MSSSAAPELHRVNKLLAVLKLNETVVYTTWSCYLQISHARVYVLGLIFWKVVQFEVDCNE